MYRDSPDKMNQAFTEEFEALTTPPKDSLFDDVSSDEEYLSCRRVVRFTDPDSTPSLLPLDLEDSGTAEQLEQPAVDMDQTWTCNPDKDKAKPVVEESYHHPLPSERESPIYKPPPPLSPIPEVPPQQDIAGDPAPLDPAAEPMDEADDDALKLHYPRTLRLKSRWRPTTHGE